MYNCGKKGKILVKEHVLMTHGHGQVRGLIVKAEGWDGWRRVKGEKWDNCNRITKMIKKESYEIILESTKYMETLK